MFLSNYWGCCLMALWYVHVYAVCVCFTETFEAISCHSAHEMLVSLIKR